MQLRVGRWKWVEYLDDAADINDLVDDLDDGGAGGGSGLGGVPRVLGCIRRSG
jgi:hypothetical protein